MSDYISRQTFIADCEGRYCAPCKEQGKDANGVKCRACWVDDMLSEVLDAPAADAEPVRHGRWEHKKNDYSVAWCSKCKGLFDTTWDGKTAKEYFVLFVEAYRYCPRCGAKMCLEDNDEN